MWSEWCGYRASEMTSTFGRALLVEILFQFDSTVPKDSSLGRLFICTSSSLRMPKPITCVFQLSVRAIALGIATSKVAKLLGSNERFIETHVRRIQSRSSGTDKRRFSCRRGPRSSGFFARRCRKQIPIRPGLGLADNATSERSFSTTNA
jgi:hypothetical protein